MIHLTLYCSSGSVVLTQFRLGMFSSLFTDEEIQKIRNVTFHDVLVAVTSAEAGDLQRNVFFWKDGKNTTCLI